MGVRRTIGPLSPEPQAVPENAEAFHAGATSGLQQNDILPLSSVSPAMKIISLTYFFSAESLDDAKQGMKLASQALALAREKLVFAGFEVQTVRAATNSFEQFLAGTSDEIVNQLQHLEEAAQGIDFLSLGTVDIRLDVLESALSGRTNKTFFAVPMKEGVGGVPDRQAALRIAEVVCRLGASAPAKTKDVPAVFRMTVTGNLDAGTPYFPGGYWEQGRKPALAAALEDSGLFVEAFERAQSLEDAQQSLEQTLTAAIVPLEKTMKSAAEAVGVDYVGIDCSLASSAAADESVVRAYEALGVGRLGGAGTLTLSAMITAILKRLPVTRCGYSGLMLPVTEDAGLANNCAEGLISVQQLLFYFAVCGTGIDTVPVEGSTSPERLAMVYMDMASLAFRLKKPLSARLWPVAGKRAGDMTEVDNPFFVNTKVLTVDPVPNPGHKPSVCYESVAGVNGECSVLSDSPEALVLRVDPGVEVLAFVVRNTGCSPWPSISSFRCLDVEGGCQFGDVMDVPAAAPGETVTVSLHFHGAGRYGRYRLAAGDVEFGPVVIVVV